MIFSEMRVPADPRASDAARPRADLAGTRAEGAGRRAVRARRSPAAARSTARPTPVFDREIELGRRRATWSGSGWMSRTWSSSPGSTARYWARSPTRSSRTAKSSALRFQFALAIRPATNCRLARTSGPADGGAYQAPSNRPGRRARPDRGAGPMTGGRADRRGALLADRLYAKVDASTPRECSTVFAPDATMWYGSGQRCPAARRSGRAELALHPPTRTIGHEFLERLGPRGRRRWSKRPSPTGAPTDAMSRYPHRRSIEHRDGRIDDLRVFIDPTPTQGDRCSDPTSPSSAPGSAASPSAWPCASRHPRADLRAGSALHRGRRRRRPRGERYEYPRSLGLGDELDACSVVPSERVYRRWSDGRRLVRLPRRRLVRRALRRLRSPAIHCAHCNAPSPPRGARPTCTWAGSSPASARGRRARADLRRDGSTTTGEPGRRRGRHPLPRAEVGHRRAARLLGDQRVPRPRSAQRAVGTAGPGRGPVLDGPRRPPAALRDRRRRQLPRRPRGTRQLGRSRRHGGRRGRDVEHGVAGLAPRGAPDGRGGSAEPALGMFALPPLTRWSKDRVVLLGDAAHAMLPHHGQGANQTIEDAAVLADCLHRTDDIPAALAAYERRRRGRTRQVQRSSWVTSALLHLPDGPERGCPRPPARRPGRRLQAGSTPTTTAL